jgi:hypothetical protein
LAIGFYDFDLILAVRRHALATCATAVLCSALAASAQYPGQLSKPAPKEPILRAISVLEWTGPEGHPKACRLVPIAVFDGTELQDGSIYLARPQPLSLAGEVEYELQRNGKVLGLFEIRNAGQEQGSWVGYGAWKAAPAPKPKPVTPLIPLNPSWDDPDDRPVLHRKHHADDAPGAKDKTAPKTGEPGTPASASDPDRPTLHKKNSGDATAPADTPTTDADRPTLHKKTDEASSGDPNTTPDPDRPTLRKKPASSSTTPDKGKKKKKNQDESGVSSLPDVFDPDRPRLKRGKSTGSTLDIVPSLLGLPPDLKQAVALSDAHTTAEHPWSFSWANPEDETKMKEALEQMARDALGLTPPPAPPAPAPAPAKHASGRKQARVVPPAEQPSEPPPPAPLVDEDFRVFELAYSSGATLVLSTHTGGQGAADKYVTLIAQPDLYGNVLVLLKNLTDAAHMDDKPRMRLVDAVDAEASNRGELLFELRGQTQRQFALYRVLRGQAERVFATAPTDIVTPAHAAGK